MYKVLPDDYECIAVHLNQAQLFESESVYRLIFQSPRRQTAVKSHNVHTNYFLSFDSSPISFVSVSFFIIDLFF